MTFSLMHRLVINGHEQFTLYKNCKFEATKAKCQCGFIRFTKAGMLNDKQLKEIKDHIAATHHTLEISHDVRAAKRIQQK